MYWRGMCIPYEHNVAHEVSASGLHSSKSQKGIFLLSAASFQSVGNADMVIVQ